MVVKTETRADGNGTGQKQNEVTDTASIHQAALDAAHRRGILTNGTALTPGTWHRFPVEGKPRSKKDGYIRITDDGLCAFVGVFGGGGERVTAEGARKLSRQETKQLHEERRAENAAKYDAAAAKAVAEFGRFEPATASNPYATTKRLSPSTLALCRVDGDDLIVPWYGDGQTTLRTYQRIKPDTRKQFRKDCEKKSNYLLIGEVGEVVYVAEGLATADAVAQATGEAVAAAGDTGNLLPVARKLRAAYPNARIVFAADNDESGAGEKAAREAAAAVGGSVVMPKETGDFNDVHAAHGLDEVRRQLTTEAEHTDRFAAADAWLRAQRRYAEDKPLPFEVHDVAQWLGRSFRFVCGDPSGSVYIVTDEGVIEFESGEGVDLITKRTIREIELSNFDGAKSIIRGKGMRWMRDALWRHLLIYIKETAPRRPVHTRSAVEGNRTILDLGDNRAAVIQDGRWSIVPVSETDVLFTANPTKAPIPQPEAGGTWDAFWADFRVNEWQRPILLANMLQSWHEGPYFMSLFTGPAGSGKSHIAARFMQLVDPDSSPSEDGLPGNADDILIMAKTAAVIKFENLEREEVGKGVSQNLCRVLKVAGSVKRALYTDFGAANIVASASVIVTAIENPFTKLDLLSRTTEFKMTPPPRNTRKGKHVEAEYNQRRGQHVGLLLDTLARGLSLLPAVTRELECLPKAGRWEGAEFFGEAVCRAAGFEPGAYRRAMARMVADAAGEALERSPIVDKFVSWALRQPNGHLFAWQEVVDAVGGENTNHVRSVLDNARGMLGNVYGVEYAETGKRRDNRRMWMLTKPEAVQTEITTTESTAPDGTRTTTTQTRITVGTIRSDGTYRTANGTPPPEHLAEMLDTVAAARAQAKRRGMDFASAFLAVRAGLSWSEIAAQVDTGLDLPAAVDAAAKAKQGAA